MPYLLPPDPLADLNLQMPLIVVTLEIIENTSRGLALSSINCHQILRGPFNETAELTHSLFNFILGVKRLSKPNPENRTLTVSDYPNECVALVRFDNITQRQVIKKKRYATNLELQVSNLPRPQLLCPSLLFQVGTYNEVGLLPPNGTFMGGFCRR